MLIKIHNELIMEKYLVTHRTDAWFVRCTTGSHYKPLNKVAVSSATASKARAIQHFQC